MALTALWLLILAVVALRYWRKSASERPDGPEPAAEPLQRWATALSRVRDSQSPGGRHRALS